jgi:imidazoleglycerol-phosphate dehydratase
MDESLAVAAVDLGGRAAMVYHDGVHVARVGDLAVELLPDFFDGFAQHARANVHLKVLYGRSSHHKIEAIFKCFARALRYACSKDKRLKAQLPSTKGLL